MHTLTNISHWAGKYFAPLVILAAVFAYFFSELAVLSNAINILLGIVMFGMGLTLKATDFSMIFKKPAHVIIGVLLQFTVMPLLALFIVWLFGFPPEIAIGIILLGSVPGGTASNVMVYLAKGDVPLSVTMTTLSTLLAPIATPFIMYLVANNWLPVDPFDLFLSITQIVLIPIILGIIVNSFFSRGVQKVTTALPLVSVTAIILIVMGVVAANADNIIDVGLPIFAAAVLHNGGGYLLGYWIAKLLNVDPAQCRAVSIEVGMQNSGLASGLGAAHFSPLAALPGAIFSVWHNISGPILANYWSRKHHGKNDKNEGYR
ncbi:bile acid:sodium symporter family protein [Salicibibacter cibarius]|uniref:Bile acid:sodium symporter family protein n=1 Tax=Salicibibacter cibarius TaxID=2743000 RepID=A0A7T6Z0C9_9BACI|nr:bile acid:sodium symporter family protein [Salicibibacter cibarius]QQK74640.1 bile acid:sodium symporter family protein [Salicibibacter cibarius]